MTIPGDNSPACPRIAVIGGGFTGLAAAHRVRELLPHAELALFEATGRLGGVVETVHRNGFLIERSADNFLTRLPHAVDLCRRLGMADQLISTDETRRRAFVVKDRRLLPIPDGFFLMSPRKLWPVLTSPVLSIPGKLRLLAEPFIRRGNISKNVNPELRALNPSADESVASFARRRLGRETFERLVQPLVAGIYTADPEKLSMAATMPEFLAQERDYGSLLRSRRAGRFRRLEHVEGSDQDESASGARYGLFAAPRDGLASLVSALANRLPAESIHLNTPISGIHQRDDGSWELGAGNRQFFDAVIVSLPAHIAAKQLERSFPELSAELAAIEYAGCAVVSLGFNRDQIGHPLDGFGFVVPQVEGGRIVAASFASQKFPGRAPADAVLIRVFIGGALQPELLDMQDNDLGCLALDELRDLLHISGAPMLTDIARWPLSMPQYHVGHLERVSRIESLAASHSSLALAGNAYHGVGIPQCVASGEAAADRVAAWVTASEPRLHPFPKPEPQ